MDWKRVKVIWGPLQKNVVTVHFWGVFEGVPYSLDLGPSSYFSRERQGSGRGPPTFLHTWTRTPGCDPTRWRKGTTTRAANHSARPELCVCKSWSSWKVSKRQFLKLSWTTAPRMLEHAVQLAQLRIGNSDGFGSSQRSSVEASCRPVCAVPLKPSRWNAAKACWERSSTACRLKQILPQQVLSGYLRTSAFSSGTKHQSLFLITLLDVGPPGKNLHRFSCYPTQKTLKSCKLFV